MTERRVDGGRRGDPRDLSDLGDLGDPTGDPTLDSVRAAPVTTVVVPLPRWFVVLTTACTILLVPWIVYLATALPAHARAAHYDLAWVGFDIAMFFALAAVVWCAVRRSALIAVAASITATLLVVDAWFDTTTTSHRQGLVFSILSAVFIELPLAGLCIWVAVNAERVRQRAYRRLWQRAEYVSAVANRLAAGQRRARRMR